MVHADPTSFDTADDLAIFLHAAPREPQPLSPSPSPSPASARPVREGGAGTNKMRSRIPDYSVVDCYLMPPDGGHVVVIQPGF